MDDLSLLTELRPDFRLPELDELASARSRLASAIAAESAAGRSPRPAAGHHRRRAQGLRRRLPFTTGAPAVAAGVVAGLVVAGLVVAGLVIAGLAGGRSTPVIAQHPAGRASVRATVPVTAGPATPGPRPSAPGQPTRQEAVLAASFLHQAADAVLRQGAGEAAPGPGQFVYSETKTVAGAIYQIWLSADGSQPGLVINGQGRSKVPACTVARGQANRCSESAGYLPGMPAGLPALRTFLASIGVIDKPSAGFQPPPGWAANDLGKAADSLMSTTYLAPAQRAALFRLLAATPGFTIVHGGQDAVGRPGVAVRWVYGGGYAEIILNPVTYAYLGDRTTYSGESPADYTGAALVQQAVVNQSGQLP
jgi:hypothetical protein